MYVLKLSLKSSIEEWDLLQPTILQNKSIIKVIVNFYKQFPDTLSKRHVDQRKTHISFGTLYITIMNFDMEFDALKAPNTHSSIQQLRSTTIEKEFMVGFQFHKGTNSTLQKEHEEQFVKMRKSWVIQGLDKLLEWKPPSGN